MFIMFVSIIFSMTMTLMLLMILNNPPPPAFPFQDLCGRWDFHREALWRLHRWVSRSPAGATGQPPQKNRSASKGPEMKNQRFSHVYMFIHMCIYIYFILYLYLFQKYQKYIRKRRDIFFWKHGIWVKFQTLAPNHSISTEFCRLSILLQDCQCFVKSWDKSQGLAWWIN